jgi:hypothetical protein
MPSVNPFAVAGASLPAGFLQGFLVVMVLVQADAAVPAAGVSPCACRCVSRARRPCACAR